jgi:diguanylate cyclase (GGDEF)-like protein
LITRALEGEVIPVRYDLHCSCADGSTVILETQTTDLPGGLQGVSRDVTELRTLQDGLAALALRDPLTGLANRHLLNELLEVSLARTERSGLPLAVAFLDLDALKKVNDTYGHDAGDVVLRETASRLLTHARTADVVARLGGDEFVIVYEPTELASDRFIARIHRALSEPIDVTSSVSLCCTASIGHADTRTVGRDPAKLLAAADRAMYEAKRGRIRDLID